MDVERPEASPEGEVLLVVDGLVAEEDDPVLDEGAVDLLERLVVERLAQVDPGDLGPDRRGEGVDGDVPVVHRSASWLNPGFHFSCVPRRQRPLSHVATRGPAAGGVVGRALLHHGPRRRATTSITRGCGGT